MRIRYGLALLMAAGGVLGGSEVRGQGLYIVGQYLFNADVTGATTGTSVQYDSNATSPFPSLSFRRGGSSVVRPYGLTAGDNTFTFNVLGDDTVGGNRDLGLFFSTVASNYNPSTSRTPDLLVSAPFGGSGLFVPVAGTVINSYGGPANPANGLSSLDMGGYTLAVTQFSIQAATFGPNTTGMSGFVTVHLTPDVPEPGSAVGVGIGLFCVGLLGRRACKSSVRCR